MVYKSYFERPSSALTLVVRTASEPASFAPILRRMIWSIDADQPISHVQTMEEVVADIRAAGAIVLMPSLGSFAGLALAMAVVAVFGVVATPWRSGPTRSASAWRLARGRATC